MLGTKQTPQESLKAPDNTFCFHAKVVAKAPTVFCSPPCRKRVKGNPPQLTFSVSRWEGKDYETGEIFEDLRIGFNAQILMKVNVTLLSFFLLTV